MRGKAVIAGIGHTAFGKQPDRSTVSLNIEACRNAVADAGIEKDVIDGLLVKVPTSKVEMMYGQKLADEFDAPADRPRVRHARAAAFTGAKKPAEAEALLRVILDDDPDDAVACNDLGYHLASTRRPRRSARVLAARARYGLRLDAWNAAATAFQRSPLWKRRHPRL